MSSILSAALMEMRYYNKRIVAEAEAELSSGSDVDLKKDMTVTSL